MDPLTLFVLGIVGSGVMRARRGAPPIRHFFPKDDLGLLAPHSDWVALRGQRVTWLVEKGLAVWIDARKLRPVSGNLFDSAKLYAVADGIRSGDAPPLMAGYGQITRITRGWIEESQRYAKWDVGDPWTTGDPELDAYLADEDADEDPELEERLAEAEANGDGDFGQWTATVRDGNHRSFGAVLSGETRVLVRLYDNDVEDLRTSVRKGFSDRRGDENRALLEKAIRDTGHEPYWLKGEITRR